MTSTIVRNSRLPDDWLRQACQTNPVALHGTNFLSGPVRLAFPHLFEPKDQGRLDKKTGKPVFKYEVNLLFPPIADLSIPWNAAVQMASVKWPQNVVNGNLVGVGLPFTPQDDKSIKYEGYTPGGFKLTARTGFAPFIKDANTHLDVTDRSRIYPGVWAICEFNFYTSTEQGNRVNTGINAVYLFADDLNLGGGGTDPAKALAVIKGMAPIMGPPTALNPAASQGAPAATGYTPPQTYQNAPNVAPPAPQAAYAPPSGSYAAPAASYAPVVETEEQRMLREAGLV